MTAEVNRTRPNFVVSRSYCYSARIAERFRNTSESNNSYKSRVFSAKLFFFSCLLRLQYFFRSVFSCRKCKKVIEYTLLLSKVLGIFRIRCNDRNNLRLGCRLVNTSAIALTEIFRDGVYTSMKLCPCASSAFGQLYSGVRTRQRFTGM